ncbi:MAG: DNA-deoxyinosine glycosylase [Eubacteriales bacterium]|nr:DNA-deoxyinosine glycosylase [Eubacteriales bacterium]
MFGPLDDGNARILILGSFPSVKSREQQFYYGHPQNRFWKVLAAVLDCPVPSDIPEKRAMLLTHHIALWDVIESCTITGSSDASIRDVTVNDLSALLGRNPVESIFVNGAAAYRFYEKYARPLTGREAVKLPSTSPANAAWQLPRLIEAWKKIME